MQMWTHTRITNLNKSIDRIIIFCTYNNLCIPQMGVCKVTIIDKGIGFQYSLFSVLQIRLELLGMLDHKMLRLLNIKCNTSDDEQKRKTNI